MLFWRVFPFAVSMLLILVYTLIAWGFFLEVTFFTVSLDNQTSHVPIHARKRHLTAIKKPYLCSVNLKPQMLKSKIWGPEFKSKLMSSFLCDLADFITCYAVMQESYRRGNWDRPHSNFYQRSSSNFCFPCCKQLVMVTYLASSVEPPQPLPRGGFRTIALHVLWCCLLVWQRDTGD